jgi:ubiquinone/menaquinone biosynthesis C-methylase UbiE
LSVAHSEQPWLKLVQSDAASMPFPDEHFDTVMFISAIEQVPKAIVGSALKEVARVLKPGGMLYLVIHKEYIDPFVVPTAIRYLWEQLHKFGISLAKRNKRTVGFDGTLTEIRTMVEEYLHQVQLSCVERRALMTKFDWAFYKRLSPQLAQQMIPVGAALNALPLNYYKDLEYWLYQKK